MLLSVAGILAVTYVIIMIEVPSLLKKGLKRELWVFSLLLLIGVSLAIAKGLHIDIPNPLNGFIFVFKPFSDFLYKFLK